MRSRILEIQYLRQVGLINEQQENNDGVVKNTLLDLKVILDGTFTFGTGITAFLPIVRDIINSEQPQITEQSIILVYITAMWIILNRHKDKVDKLIKIIREQGLGDALSRIVDFLKSLEDVALKVSDEVGYAASNIADVAAFTFLAFPILDGLVKLVGSGDITFGEPSGYLKSILISVGILSVKNVFNNIIRRVKSRFGTLDESSHIMKYNDLGISNDVLNVIRETLFVESKELWILPQDINNGKKYNFNGVNHNVELSISRNPKISENFTLDIRKDSINSFKILLEINPVSEPKVYKEIKYSLKECFGNYGHLEKSITLTEQTDKSKSRVVFDDDEYKVVVPLSQDSFCELASNTQWCKHSYQQWMKGRGTNYIVYNKNKSTKHLVHDSGRVFLYRDGKSNYFVVGKNDERQNIKNFLSDSLELRKFFKIDYTAEDMIKYNVNFSDSTLLGFGETNNFSKAVYNVMNGKNPDSLEPFTGPTVNIVDWGAAPIEPGANVELGDFGLTYFFNEETFQSDFLDGDDNEFYYLRLGLEGNSGYGGYGGYADSLEWEELDYLCDKIDDAAEARFMALLEKINPNLERSELCEEGRLSELMMKYFESEWQSTGDDILYTLGAGLEDFRVKELGQNVREELTILPEEIGDGTGGMKLYLTYEQLLGLIDMYNLESLGDLSESGFNEIPHLSDTFYDSWGYSEDVAQEVKDDINSLLDRLEEDTDIDWDVRKKNYDEHDRVLKQLGFSSDINYQNNIYDLKQLNPNPSKEEEISGTYTLHYRVSDFNPTDSTIKLYVGTTRPYNTNYNNQVNSGEGKVYKIKISELSDYILSGDLFAGVTHKMGEEPKYS